MPAMPAPLPSASLVICSRNRRELLADTVSSILGGEDIPAEIVVIDQSAEPHPRSAEWSSERRSEIRYHHRPDRGIARARNQGIRAARNDIVAVTDDDMIATPKWFGTLIATLVAEGRDTVVTGAVAPEAGAERVPSCKDDRRPAVYAGRVPIDPLYTSNMALFREALDAIGWFDERLGPGAHWAAAEDNDVGYRLLEHGYRIVYAPEALLYHRAWRAGGQLLRLRWAYGRGQGGFYAKHLRGPGGHIRRRLRHDLTRHLRTLVRGVLRPGHAAGEAAYVAGLVSGVAEWLLTQPTSRRASPSG